MNPKLEPFEDYYEEDDYLVRSSPRSETEWVAMLHRNLLNVHDTHRIMGLGSGRDWQGVVLTFCPLICFCHRLAPVGVFHSFGVVLYGGSHLSPNAGWYRNSQVLRVG
uniref:Uncharacterized protein n=1 Tax=Setaria viridis TaxID=4556 RepID=A0A4V6D325_SETVI|nr:hypothetical protein SEVIR_8G144400v2 [Setaria viridis]